MSDPNQTTSFEVNLPGGTKVNIASKRLEVFIWLLIAASLAFNGVQTWYVQAQLELLTFRVQEMARGIREQTCLQYIPEADRTKYVGQAAACKKMGEMQ